LTPVLCTEQELANLARREAKRIVCATHFSEQYIAARGLATDGFMSNQLAIPALTTDGYVASHEVKLAPRGSTVDYARWVEHDLGVVEESRFGEQRLIRLTLPEHQTRGAMACTEFTGHDATSLHHAAFAGYSYLFRRQRSKGWTALRYTNYVRGVIDVDNGYVGSPELADPGLGGTYMAPQGQRYVSFNHGRFDAWEQSGPKQIGGSTAVSYEPAGGRPWRPVCPAATGIGSKGGDLIVEAWYTASPEVGVSYVENARQTPAWRYDERYGKKPPVFARGTYIETATGAGMIISGTASILQSEIVCDPELALRGAPEAEKSSILEQCLRSQFSLTVENIRFLMSATNLHPQGVDAAFTLEDLTGVRIYLKGSERMWIAREEAARLFPSGTPMIFLENHICRPGWLLEIEGLAWRRKPRAELR
jgi:hypothetical protein